jgi:hypothetical protein
MTLEEALPTKTELVEMAVQRLKALQQNQEGGVGENGKDEDLQIISNEDLE